MASMIPAAAGLGQQWARNPVLNAPDWVPNLLGKADPLGNAITKIGGDPLNLYGNKNNPNALLFPSVNPNGGTPTQLPTLGLGPQFYSSDSFAARPTDGGPYNSLAAMLAGPMYNPVALPRVPGPAFTAGGAPSTPQAPVNAGVGGGIRGVTAPSLPRAPIFPVSGGRR